MSGAHNEEGHHPPGAFHPGAPWSRGSSLGRTFYVEHSISAAGVEGAVVMVVERGGWAGGGAGFCVVVVVVVVAMVGGVEAMAVVVVVMVPGGMRRMAWA